MFGNDAPKDRSIGIGDIIDTLHEHLTGAMCGAAFRKVRTTERQREWSLFNLVRFWTAVVLKSPPSLTIALEECRRGGRGLLPDVRASAPAFFQRCRDLKPEFFVEVFARFIKSILPEAPCAYAAELSSLRERFNEVWIIDASKLAKVAHRLKILRNIKEAVLPGCLTVCYDLFRGITREIAYSTDAAESEHRRAEELIPCIPKGTLLIGDALHATIRLFRTLASAGSHGLFRRNRLLKVKKLGPTPGRRKGRGEPKDDLVEIGCGINQPKLTVRRIKSGGFELFTDVLDPKKLTAEEALTLYRYRWQIERMFFDLKEVLSLNQLYTTAPRSVAMQVFATAIVHAAMRVAQSKFAKKAGVAPEMLSPKKLFPRLAAASIERTEAVLTIRGTRRANPGMTIQEPNWNSFLRSSRIRLHSVLVEPRLGRRRKRKFDPQRRRWISYGKIKGSRKLS